MTVKVGESLLLSSCHDFLGENLIDHSSTEVRHVLLSEGDAGSASQGLSEHAGEHAAVAAIHLVWDILKNIVSK